MGEIVVMRGRGGDFAAAVAVGNGLSDKLQEPVQVLTCNKRKKENG